MSSRLAGGQPAPRATPPSLVRTSSGEQVALHIRRLIFEGQLRPGMRVPQDEVARELGVSRIPVREALIALEREGWVSIELHRGAFVCALDEQAVHDHYELFGLIYGFAAGRALERKGPELLERLEALQRQVAASGPDRVGHLLICFHAAIVEAAASPRIKVVLRALSALVPGDFFEEVPRAIEIERVGLGAILRALQAQDPDRAALEYRKMMRRIGDEVAAVFKERGLLGAEEASA